MLAWIPLVIYFSNICRLQLYQPYKMSSMKSRRKKGGRVQRLTSNVFAMFDQAQIQEFKVTFRLNIYRLLNTKLFQ